MKVSFFSLVAGAALTTNIASAQLSDTTLVTPFESSNGKQTATYDDVNHFYRFLAKVYPTIDMGDMGPADNGYPLRYAAYTNDGNFDKDALRKSGKVVILVNNAIHPGEPDGVDASMMLMRDIAMGKVKIPDNIFLVVVPMYNLGGALNRNSHSRANQNGPESYGFRGNSRNLDLNRDFMKCDAAETLGLEDLFSKMDPDIFVDNHVSNGADYQHVMTLLETQYEKLGGKTGQLMHNKITPLLFKDMKKKGYDLVPYVNVWGKTPDNGWQAFFDPPRFSSGYAALFQCMAYVPETHMLKPFDQRVRATYELMTTIIQAAGDNAAAIKAARAADREALMQQKVFPLAWKIDTTQHETIEFKGYQAGTKKSEVSGLDRLYYDRSKPYTKKVPYYDHFVPTATITAPRAYIIPKTWTPIIICLRASGVHIQRLNYDSVMEVTTYRIDNYETVQQPYESHYVHKDIRVTADKQYIQFTRGDYIVWLNQPAKRYLVEAFEPTSPDGFFAWNFFDGILQQKEHFSAYVFEDVAAEMLKKNPALKEQLEEKRKADKAFANDAHAQLEFIYQHSPYLEPEYMRYPVYRLEEKK